MNLVGVVRITTAFLPLPRRSADPVVVNVSSAMGRPGQRGRPGYTATDLNGNSGPQTVTEGTDAVVTLATEGPGPRLRAFVERDGEIAWSWTTRVSP